MHICIHIYAHTHIYICISLVKKKQQNKTPGSHYLKHCALNAFSFISWIITSGDGSS